MSEVSGPPPGSFCLSKIPGIFGFLVWLGQLLAGDTSKWTHAFMVLDNGEIIEAETEGVRIGKLSDRLRDRQQMFCDKPVKDAVDRWTREQLSAGAVITLRDVTKYEASLRARIVATAREFEGAKYGWLSYVYIGLRRLGFEGLWLRKKIASSGSLICSQLVDFSYWRTDLHLFTADRWAGEVTPGDLAHYAGESLVHVG